MFWGLVVEPGKRYSQQVGRAFHVSMATLEVSNDTNEFVPLMLEYEDGREYLLCNLHKGKCMQCPLDLNFKEGEKIGFYTSLGRSKVYLTGYLLEDLENDLSSEDEDEEEEVISQKTAPKRKESPAEKTEGKKIKLTEAFDEIVEEEEDDSDFEVMGEDENEEVEEEDDGEDDDDDDDDDDEEEEEEEDSDELTAPKVKNVKTPSEKGPGKEAGNKPKTPIKEQNGQMKTPASQKKKKSGETPKGVTPSKSPKRTLQGGVVVEDTVIGSGVAAKPGSKVAVYYVGRLKQNNKQFDSTTSGAGFKFTLGRNEVIKGWDVGLSGMCVGGKRTITIPAGMAYGKKGQPPVIPPNSTLVFDVELKNVF